MEKMKMLLEQAIDQMVEEEEERNDVVLVNHDGDQDQHDRDLLLSKLISQLEKQRVEGKCDKSRDEGLTDTSNKLVGPPAAPQIDHHVLVEEPKSEIAKADEIATEEILKELKKVRRQNLITHCLLSFMIVITVAWQLSEVKLIMKVKDGLSHPFRSVGSAVTRMLKPPIPPSTNGGQEGDNKHSAN